jgi:Family of unknown function (DUF6065)
MIRYFKFRQELFAPTPAKEIYIKRAAGKGWPEECPPIRGANAFGFDLLANFDVTFHQSAEGEWTVADDVTIESDFDYTASESADGAPLSQQYAWFWERGQTIPHVISDNVWNEIKNQVKVSTFLFLQSDPNELLYMTDVPNSPPQRNWRAITAMVETDWYPASYPWHVVLELSKEAKSVSIRKGDPLCRVIPVRRDSYFAKQMSSIEFDDFFSRGQRWLATHGRVGHEAKPADPGVVDITRTYSKQQLKSRFVDLG